MKSLILAGGFGTRLKEIVKDIPKPMVSIAGKPFLEHQINYLKKQGIEDIILGVHYKADLIKSYFGNGMRQGVNITYSEEENPLGTGGAIKFAEKYLGETFLVLNGDSYTDVDISKFKGFHDENKNLGSLVLTKIEDRQHYGSIELEGNKIKAFNEKGDSKEGLINSGIYIFEPEIFDYIDHSRKVSLELEVLPPLVNQKKLNGFVHEGYFIDIGRPETYSRFKQDFLKRLQSCDEIDIREALRRLRGTDSDILFIVGSDKKFLGLLTNNSIKNYLIQGGKLEDKVSEAMIPEPGILGKIHDSEEQIKSYLAKGINQLPILDEEGKIHDIRFRAEEIKREEYPTVRGKAPLRISFAGGGTDMPHFFEENGGAIISTTIDKYCTVTARRRGDSKIVIDSDLYDQVRLLDSKNLVYDGNHDIIKSVYKLLNLGFGMDLYLHNDLPPRRGLGSSASFAVLLTKTFGKLKGVDLDDETLAELAYRVEVEELGIRGGKQDQYAAVFGGFNWMEFEKGDKKIMHPLKLKEDTLDELRSHLTLCYTNLEHESSLQHDEGCKKYAESPGEIVLRLNSIKDHALELKQSLLSPKPNFQRMGEIMHNSWEAKKKLAQCVSNEKIDRLYSLAMENGVYGGKLLGSGGGGYLLFVHPPKKRNSIEKVLKENDGEILSFNFESSGTRVWYVDR